MRAMVMVALVGLALVGTPCAATAQGRPWAPAGAGPQAASTPADVVKEVRFDQNLNGQVPLDAEFRDEEGRTVRLGAYFGRKPVVLALVYYDCPMLCTLVLNGLTRSLRAMSFTAGNEFEIVTVSFDAREGPALGAQKKKLYLEHYGRAAESGWHFLTGEAESIRRLTEAVGFRFIWDGETSQFAHASGLVVLTPEGKISKYFYGVEYAPRDLRLGLVEASAGKIGSATDRVLLFCYHYDPATGKYGLVIMNVIRVAGTGTAIGLALFITAMLRREKSRSWKLEIRNQKI